MAERNPEAWSQTTYYSHAQPTAEWAEAMRLRAASAPVEEHGEHLLIPFEAQRVLDWLVKPIIDRFEQRRQTNTGHHKTNEPIVPSHLKPGSPEYSWYVAHIAVDKQLALLAGTSRWQRIRRRLPF